MKEHESPRIKQGPTGRNQGAGLRHQHVSPPAGFSVGKAGCPSGESGFIRDFPVGNGWETAESWVFPKPRCPRLLAPGAGDLDIGAVEDTNPQVAPATLRCGKSFSFQ